MSDPVSLRDHLERLLAEQDRRYEQRFAAQEQATVRALEAKNKTTALFVSFAALIVSVVAVIAATIN